MLWLRKQGKLTDRVGEMDDQNVNVDVLCEELENPQVSGAIDERGGQADQGGRDKIERHILNPRQSDHKKAIEHQRYRILDLPTVVVEAKTG